MASIAERKARLITERLLVQLAEFAAEQSVGLLTAYDRRELVQARLLAEDALDTLDAGMSDLLGLSAVDEDAALSEASSQELSALAAVSAHALAAIAYEQGRQTPVEESPTLIMLALRRVERRYRDLLMDSRVAAETGDGSIVREVFTACVESLRGDVGYLARSLAGQDDAVKADALAAIRLSAVSRRLCMLACACPHLLFRLTNSRKAAGVKQVAERRTRLMQADREMLAALRRVEDVSEGDVLRISARCQSVQFVEEDDGYTAITVDAGQLKELRLDRRNAQRVGVTEEAWLYLKGEVRSDGESQFLSVNPRPVSEEAGEVWEDYLITQVRDAYDLVPGSIDMQWEFPPMQNFGARNDLYGRL
ncbi:MAG: hypothetical protein AAGI72_16615 [Pseudomonadota bacterium]